MKNFLILGCGNMAQAMVMGFYENSKHEKPRFRFSFYTPSQTKAQNLALKTGGEHVETIPNPKDFEYILIACKPQQFEKLSLELKGKIKDTAVVISILAGISSMALQEKLAHKKVVRVMPNTPALIGEGSNLVYFSSSISLEDQADVQYFLTVKFKPHIFQSDDEIDKITGVIASGPAYIFEFARLFAQYLEEKCNLTPDLANTLTNELFLGSVHLMNSSTDSFEELRNKVTSKGGVTFAALESFKNAQLTQIFYSAFNKAYMRTKELAEENSASK
jgi:pyrroline-5-carboxylate reductase